MTTARFRVIHAGPLVSIQDAGRVGHMRFGVPASGPMDRTAFAIANTALAQPAGETGIEVSPGGLILECIEGSVTYVVAGGGFSVVSGGAKFDGWHVATIREGEKLAIRGGAWGSWAYLAFAGKLACNQWLGHSATHSMSGFGGGLLQAEQELEIRDAEVREGRIGEIPVPDFARPMERVRVVTGPQDQHFEADSVSEFFQQKWELTDSYDRMGVRLKGPEMRLNEVLSIPSEPVLRGAVQVSGDGGVMVLLADCGTTGGYPKIATVLPDDLDRMVQCTPGDAVRFETVSPEQAIEIKWENSKRRNAYLQELATPRLSLGEKLLRENLIGGMVSARED